MDRQSTSSPVYNHGDEFDAMNFIDAKMDKNMEELNVLINNRTLVRVGPKQTVFNPFLRWHSEPSPSECGQ